MTENELREKVVAQASYWLGRKEADESHRVIIDVYNSIDPLPRDYRMKYDDPWCAAFVSAVAQVCELTGIIFPECGCKPMMKLYQEAGKWMEDDAYIPKPGDVMFYDWEDDGNGDNTGTPDHVGIVTSVSGNVINCIEGNYSDSVMQTAHLVDSQFIRGFGLPDYSSIASENPAPSPDDGENNTDPSEPENPVDDYNASFPTITKGDKWGHVYTAQALLIARGYDCGNRNWRGVEIPDGEFGHMTELAVASFQENRKILPSGNVDPETWAQLFIW